MRFLNQTPKILTPKVGEIYFCRRSWFKNNYVEITYIRGDEIWHRSITDSKKNANNRTKSCSLILNSFYSIAEDFTEEGYELIKNPNIKMIKLLYAQD